MRVWNTTSRFILDLLQGAKERGIDIDILLECVNLTSSTLSEENNVALSQDQFCLLVLRLITELDDVAFSLLEKKMPISTFKLSYYCAKNGKTVGEALEIFAEFFNSYENSIYFDVVKESGKLRFRVHPNVNGKIKNNYPLIYYLSKIYRLSCYVADTRIRIDAVNFGHEAPDYVEEYEYMFYGFPVYFDKDHSEILFPNESINLPVSKEERDFEMSPEWIIQQFIQPESLSESLKLWLMSRLKETQNMPTIEESAQHFAMARQTILRKLNKEGTNFKDLKSEVWKKLSTKLILESNQSVDEIATKLGFSEAASFTRAFKRWTGFTPKAFRDQKLL